MTSGAIRVIACDDSATIRALLKRVLELSPRVAVVGEAADGLEAIRAVERLRPDVVLLDISMPVLDGLEALPAIRRCSPATRVIVFSGFAEAALGAVALELGADRYLEKGVDPDVLIAAVEALGSAPRTEHDVRSA